MLSSPMDMIVAECVTKTYRAGVGRARVREMLPWPLDRAVGRLFPRWWARDTFNALQEVSLTIPAGSSVGIVGPNGAGKTTLLKLISGVAAPTSGRVISRGRVGALIDVLVGFHPDLTGRENIYLLAAIHGLSGHTTEKRIEDILKFAEISDLADTPLKRYSAGMGARLGFATLAALDLDIFLIDEVLAVGDAAFQRKCAGWLEDYAARGGTLVFVSHNLALVRNMTEHAVWLDQGTVVREGPSREVVAAYAKAMEHREGGPPTHRRMRALKALDSRGLNRWGAGGARVERVNVGEIADDLSLRVALSYEVTNLEEAIFCVGFIDDAGRELGAATSQPIRLNGSSGVAECTLRPVPFRSGIYFPVVAIMSPDGVVRDRWRLDRAVVIDQDGQAHLSETFGPVDIHASWSIG